MSFVDPETLGLGRTLVLKNILGLLGGIPEASVVDRRNLKFLSGSGDPSW